MKGIGWPWVRFNKFAILYDMAGEKRRWALFSSPVKRTVGTVLIVSACDFLSSSFALVEVDVPPSKELHGIPTIVLNICVVLEPS